MPVLGAAKGRDLSGGATWNQRIGTLRNLPFDQLAECVLGDTTLRKGRHERRDRAEKHELTFRIESFSVDKFVLFSG